MDEAKEMYRKLRCYDAVSEARKRTPDATKYPHPEYQIAVKIPLINTLEVLPVIIYFRKRGRGKYQYWEYHKAKSLNNNIKTKR